MNLMMKVGGGSTAGSRDIKSNVGWLRAAPNSWVLSFYQQCIHPIAHLYFPPLRL